MKLTQNLERIQNFAKVEQLEFYKNYIVFTEQYERLIECGLTSKRQTNLPDLHEDFILRMSYSFGK